MFQASMTKKAGKRYISIQHSPLSVQTGASHIRTSNKSRHGFCLTNDFVTNIQNDKKASRALALILYTLTINLCGKLNFLHLACDRLDYKQNTRLEFRFIPRCRPSIFAKFWFRCGSLALDLRQVRARPRFGSCRGSSAR